MSQLTPAQQVAHDLTNRIQAVTGFICLERYDKAQESAREATELLASLRQWVAFLEGCVALDEKAG